MQSYSTNQPSCPTGRTDCNQSRSQQLSCGCNCSPQAGTPFSRLSSGILLQILLQYLVSQSFYSSLTAFILVTQTDSFSALQLSSSYQTLQRYVGSTTHTMPIMWYYLWLMVVYLVSAETVTFFPAWHNVLAVF